MLAWTGDPSEVNLQDNKLTVTAFVIIAHTAQKRGVEAGNKVSTESWGGQQGYFRGERRRERKARKPAVKAGEGLASGRVSSVQQDLLVTEVLHPTSD